MICNRVESDIPYHPYHFIKILQRIFEDKTWREVIQFIYPLLCTATLSHIVSDQNIVLMNFRSTFIKCRVSQYIPFLQSGNNSFCSELSSNVIWSYLTRALPACEGSWIPSCNGVMMFALILHGI